MNAPVAPTLSLVPITPPAVAAAVTPSVQPTPIVLRERPAPQRPKIEWYGAPILIADAAALASTLAIGALSRGNSWGLGAGVGLTAYTVAGPVVHWANRQVGPGFGSLALRVGTPLSCAFWGVLAGQLLYPNADGAETGAMVGAALGVVVASVVDSAVLAYARPANQSPTLGTAPKSAQKPRVAWVPSASVDPRGGLNVGVGGSF